MTFLTPHHISLTLRAICYGRPLPTTPLFRLKSIPFDMHNTIFNEILMTDWLVSLICQQLNYQRTIHHLSPLTPTTKKEETEVAITQAYVINAPYLQAWMVLYARVVRTDLNLTMIRLGELTSTHPRTLRRRQKLGIHCLYVHIIRLERE